MHLPPLTGKLQIPQDLNDNAQWATLAKQRLDNFFPIRTKNLWSGDVLKGANLAGIYRFFCLVGRDCSYLTCGHHVKEDISCKRAISVDSNTHATDKNFKFIPTLALLHHLTLIEPDKAKDHEYNKTYPKYDEWVEKAGF